MGLSKTRLREAKILLAYGEYSGAYYLAGYVVECALKACISKRTLKHDFPNKERANASWSHSLIGLVQIAGLQGSLEAESRADGAFSDNWSVVKDWRTDTRYGSKDEKEAEGLIHAITDRRHGVLRWLRRHW